jgi:DNA-binding NtrC family response regulator
MPFVRIVIGNSLLKQIVRSVVDYPAAADGERPDLLIVELTGEPESKGAAAVREWRSVDPRLPVVVVSLADCAVVLRQAVRLRIDDYFRLPDESSDFQTAVSALVDRREALTSPSNQENVLLGSSPQITALRKYVARVALTDSSVLVTGETGTGKELVAQMIHGSSARQDKPFVCVNSAALPDTLLESELFGFEKGAFTGAHAKYQGKLRLANGGTIFFDEIGDLSLMAQAKLLRAIESREVNPLGGGRGLNVDIRFIAATNRDLEAITQTGEFRRDLFYRLNVVRIELPPLRSRKDDIPGLLEHFIGVYNRQWNHHVEGFQPDAVELLQSYDWPGNIRELRNVVEASFVHAMSNRIEILDLPERLRRAFEEQLPSGSREKLVQTLLATNWNISRVAAQLRCSRMTVYRKMSQYCISRSPGKPCALAAKA